MHAHIHAEILRLELLTAVPLMSSARQKPICKAHSTQKHCRTVPVTKLCNVGTEPSDNMTAGRHFASIQQSEHHA